MSRALFCLADRKGIMATQRIIVVAENERLHFMSYARELNKRGFTVFYCGDADETVNLLGDMNQRGEYPALVILNRRLRSGHIFPLVLTENGERTGIVLYEHIRSQNKDIPILLHHTSPSIIQEALNPPDDPKLKRVNRTETSLFKFCDIAVEAIAV